jgi:hypothetical protein
VILVCNCFGLMSFLYCRYVSLIINKEELEKLGDAPKVSVTMYMSIILWNLEINRYLAGGSSVHVKFGGWLFS